LVSMAAGIAAIGLLTDSSPDILAAFFISPLMAMIMAVTWGCVIRDYGMVVRGARNMVVGIVVCILTGFVVGILLNIDSNKDGITMAITDTNKVNQRGIYSSISINTSQILARGPPVGNVISSFLVAALSGVAIGLGQSSGIASALAGCAMSTSLLPPLVNIGLMFGLLPAYGNIETNGGNSILSVAAYSAALYGVNVIAVMVFTFLTFKLKHIGGVTLKRAVKAESGLLDSMTDLVSPGSSYAEDESEDDVISQLLSPRARSGGLTAPLARPNANTTTRQGA